MRWSFNVVEDNGYSAPCAVCGRAFPDHSNPNGDVAYFPDGRRLSDGEEEVIRRVWGLDPLSEFAVCEMCRNHDAGEADWLDAGDWLRRHEAVRLVRDMAVEEPACALATGDPGSAAPVAAGDREPDEEPVSIRFDAILEGAKRAFCRGLETGETTLVVGGRERHWTWVLEQLEDCEDDLPADACEVCGVEEGEMSYAGAAKSWWDGMAFQAQFLPKLLDDPSLCPAALAVVRHDLDTVYRATGWKRPMADNG